MSEVKGVYCISEAGSKTFHPCIPGKTSDGYHTFDELYRHRCLLFVALMAAYPDKSWFSPKHHDGTSFDGWFVAGMSLPTGDITYHLPIEMWALTKQAVPRLLDTAPQWDGHSSSDVCDRLEAWIKGL